MVWTVDSCNASVDASLLVVVMTSLTAGYCKPASVAYGCCWLATTHTVC